MNDSELAELACKPDKTRAEWVALYKAGLANHDKDKDSFALNQIGLRGGWANYQMEIDNMRARETGPLRVP